MTEQFIPNSVFRNRMCIKEHNQLGRCRARFGIRLRALLGAKWLNKNLTFSRFCNI